MANQTTVSHETRVAIINRWDETRGWFPKHSAAEIALELGVHKDTVLRTLAKRDAIMRRDSGSVNVRPALQATHADISDFMAIEGSINIGVLPDCQVKPDVPLEHLEWAGKFFAAKKPDVIVNIGDFADMPSLSFHDVAGSMGYEGKRYKADILAAHEGMKRLMTPILAEMKRTGWNPRLVLTLGNHENRIDRTIKATPKLDGVMGLPDLEYERWGWDVHSFLKPVIINGVAFCHYFCSGVMGRPIQSARALLTKKSMSCVAGHQQGRDIAHAYKGDGNEMTAIIAGSYYLHNEDFLNHQTNNHFRGLYMLYGVQDGVIDSAVPVNINHLRRVYG